MEDKTLKKFLCDSLGIGENLVKVQKELDRLNRCVDIEKEYIDKKVEKPFYKIMVALKQEKIKYRIEAKLDWTNDDILRHLSHAKNRSMKKKSFNNGVKLYQDLYYCYHYIQEGINLVSSTIKTIDEAFVFTNCVQDCVVLMEKLKDVVEESFALIKNYKSQADYLANTFSDYIILSLNMVGTKENKNEQIL